MEDSGTDIEISRFLEFVDLGSRGIWCQQWDVEKLSWSQKSGVLAMKVGFGSSEDAAKSLSLESGNVDVED